MTKHRFILSFLCAVCLSFFASAQTTDTLYKSANNLSGKIYAGINPLPEGNIYLLRKNKSGNYILENNPVTNGNFHFKSIPSKEHLIFVIPEFNYDFLYFPKYIPTYFGNSYSWEKAQTWNTDKTNFKINYSLLSFSDPFYGNKKISGKIVYSETYKELPDLPVTIILLNESFIPMDFRTADEHTGNFSFNYLPEGTYYLHPEIPGLKSYDIKVIVGNEAKSGLNNINFKADAKNIKPEINTDKLTPVVSTNFLKVYLNNEINYPVVCELIDLSGKSAIKKIYNSENISINTAGLAAGIYILKIKTYDNSPVRTAKVFIRNY